MHTYIPHINANMYVCVYMYIYIYLHMYHLYILAYVYVYAYEIGTTQDALGNNFPPIYICIRIRMSTCKMPPGKHFPPIYMYIYMYTYKYKQDAARKHFPDRVLIG